MTTAITPATKKPKIRAEDYAKCFIIKRKGQKPLELPLDSREDTRLLQLKSAGFSALLDDFEEEFRLKIKEATPLQMKQIADSRKIEQELHRGAYPTKAGGDDDAVPDDQTALLAQAVMAGAELQKESDKLKAKHKPVEVEAEDVTDAGRV